MEENVYNYKVQSIHPPNLNALNRKLEPHNFWFLRKIPNKFL